MPVLSLSNIGDDASSGLIAIGVNGASPQKPVSKKRNANRMISQNYSQSLSCVSCTNFILSFVVGALMIIIFMNLTFVFPPDFVHTDVPFYVNPLDSAPFRQATRYGTNWYLIAMFPLKLWTLVATMGALVHASRGGSSNLVTAAQAWIVIHGLFDIGLSIYWHLLAYAPAKCAATNLCRAWTAQPADAVTIAGVPNWIFLTLLWSGYAWQIVNILYFMILQAAQELIKKRIQNAEDAAAKKEFAIK